MIAPRVRSAWVGYSTPLEAAISHLYLDTARPPIPTTATCASLMFCAPVLP